MHHSMTTIALLTAGMLLGCSNPVHTSAADTPDTVALCSMDTAPPGESMATPLVLQAGDDLGHFVVQRHLQPDTRSGPVLARRLR